MYGGIERIAEGLAAQYKKSGHEVVLVANPLSTCVHADKIIGWKGAKSQELKDIWTNAWQLYRIYTTEKPDIVHSFSRLLYLYPLFFLSKVKVVQSYQRAISAKSTTLARCLAGQRLQFTACATHLYANLPNAFAWKAVFNFTDTDYFTPADQPNKEYLLFLGRIEPIKGVKEAIEVAQKTDWPLIIAGNIPEDNQSYFAHEIEPHLNERHKYVGQVNDEQKLKLFRHAAAFLFPVQWEEPFGIVMAESLACGTPVIGLNRGSVPEVIIHKKNGFICQTIKEMEQAVHDLDAIDRVFCRQDAEQRFSSSTAAENFIRIFNSL